MMVLAPPGAKRLAVWIKCVQRVVFVDILAKIY
jgi:hypothetical protein